MTSKKSQQIHKHYVDSEFKVVEKISEYGIRYNDEVPICVQSRYKGRNTVTIESEFAEFVERVDFFDVNNRYYFGLDENFNVIVNDLRAYGHSVEYLPDFSFETSLNGVVTELSAKIMEYCQAFYSIDSRGLKPWQKKLIELIESDNADQKALTRYLKKLFDVCKKENVFSEILTRYGFSDNVELKIDENNDFEVWPIIETSNHILIAHYMSADLMHLFGRNFHKYMLTKTSQLMCNKAITFQNDCELGFYKIDGKIVKIKFNLADTMYRLPSGNKSLKSQGKVHQAKQKINLDDIEINVFDSQKTKGKLIFELANIQFRLYLYSLHTAICKYLKIPNKKSSLITNFDLLLKKLPEIAMSYAVGDVEATESLDEKTKEGIYYIYDAFELPRPDVIGNTTGSVVWRFIRALMIKHFGDEKLVKDLLKSSHIKQLETAFNNYHGFQPFETVGGLLYSRVADYPYLSGTFADIDIVSCYGTAISEDFNIYLGTPLTDTKRLKTVKNVTLKQFFDFADKEQIAKDGLIVRIESNDLIHNTLLYSNRDFEYSQKLLKTVLDNKENREYVAKYNFDNVPYQRAKSVIFTQQAKYSVINYPLWEVVNLLPDFIKQKYFDSQVVAYAYYDKKLIVDNVEDYQKLVDKLPETCSKQTGLGFDMVEQINPCKSNATLRFPMSEYIKKLVEHRKKLKKAGNPIQEVFKLFINCIYGVLSSVDLPTNNGIAANYITGKCRGIAWLMHNFCNGFQVITDGCTFSVDNMAIGYKFKDLITQNPDYLQSFDPSVKCKFKKGQFSQDWIDKNFKKELLKFYNVDKLDILEGVNFELKTESIVDKKGVVHNDIITFSEFVNYGSGNYIKGFKDYAVSYKGSEFDINEQKSLCKFRGFRKDSNLTNFVFDMLKSDKYSGLYVSEENELIKFSDALKCVISLLKNPIDFDVAIPLSYLFKKYKSPKIITRSNFLFQNEVQLKNFETNESKLFNISERFFSEQDILDLLPEYPIVDLSQLIKNYKCGVGFEALCTNKSISQVRREIRQAINNGVSDFNAYFNLGRDAFNIRSLVVDDMRDMLVKKIMAKLSLIESMRLDDRYGVIKVNNSHIQTAKDILLGSTD